MAKALQVNLEGTADVELWTQGVFELSFSYLESLIKEIGKVDFAALILTADDITKSRGRQRSAPRDNVLFELGLFMGKLGRHRCFFVYDEKDQSVLKLPSDLLGISAATYTLHASGNLDATMGSVATKIARRIAKAGCRPTFMQIAVQDETDNSSLPNISGIWDGFTLTDSHSHEKTSTLEIEQRGSFVRAVVERRVPGGVRRFDYEGRFSAGQLVLFFEDTAGRGFIIGSLVLHLSSDVQTLIGKSTFYHHDNNQVVAADRLYKRATPPARSIEKPKPVKRPPRAAQKL